MSNCILWAKGRDAYGYGAYRDPVDGKTKKAHRAAWEAVNGLIPKGMCVRHTCDNPPCVNPEHLVVGTHAQNMADKSKRMRHNRQKLTAGQIAHIQKSYKSGIMNLRELAEHHGVSLSATWAAYHGKSNRHLHNTARTGVIDVADEHQIERA